MARHRLGVILVLPDPVAGEVDGLRRAAGDAALGRVPPHVTLVPPVNVNGAEFDSAVDTVRAAAAVEQPLTLTLGPVTTFLPDTPVLYLAVGGDLAALTRLHDRVAVGPLARSQTWPFVPHVTLADGATPERIAAAVAALADYRAEVTVDRVHLMEEGPDRVWRYVADAALAAPSIVARGGLPVELAVTEALDPAGERFLGDARRRDGLAGVGGGPPVPRPFAVTARREGAVVGVALGEVDDELRLGFLIVAPEARRQGIGSHLLAAVEAVAVQHHCRRLALVAPAGGGAEAFSRQRGWVVAQALPAWRSGRDFVRLVRHLS